MTEIYPAREEPIPGVDSRKLALDIGERAVFLSDTEILPYLDEKTHGAIIIMGAGELDGIKNNVLNGI
jgi:UDP-N-acetylmuramate-alanine ligase